MTLRIFIACTGAGAGVQAEIWKVPGCSEYFAGACFPYGRDQLADFIGYEPDKSCCEAVAIEMAMMAYYRAWQPGVSAVGVGVSAAVASAKPRRGKNRAWAAVVKSSGVKVSSLVLSGDHGPAARNWHAIAVDRLGYDLAAGNEPGETEATDLATGLFFRRPLWSANGQRLPESDLGAKAALFPGAFNPPHAAHLELSRKYRAAFAIEASAPHKPPLMLAELIQRAKLLHGHDRIFTNGAPLYVDKSRRFPGRSFLIGADALIRMMDPKWGPDPMRIMYDLSDNATTLLVVGRVVDGKFVSADEAISHVPESTRFNLFPVDGRWDVSSTEIREGAA